MPKILQINADANKGSTGRIAEQINTIARKYGWETFFMFGRDSLPCKSKVVHSGNRLQVLEHYVEHRLFDNDGLASRLTTRKMVKKIERINPDIIHLHNIHDHWLNYRILFEYLNSIGTPVVWTMHDCWAFTGGCPHFSQMGCFHWRDGGCTNGCPIRKRTKMRRLFEKTQMHFQLKRKLFTDNKRLTIVPVSHWLEKMVRQSFFKDKNIITIQNGIDINSFRIINVDSVREKYGIRDNKYIIGVSSVWLPYKGWNDFLLLSRLLSSNIRLVLVGLDKAKIKEAKKHGIIGIARTQNINELSALYSEALCFCNLTYMDTFPTTNLEALACGTPVITYQTGGSPESVTQETGYVVEQGDLNGVVKAVKEIELKGKEHYRNSCRQRAVNFFNKEDKFKNYIDLYESLMK